MDANKIIVHREQRHGMRMVLDLFRECVGQPSKATGAPLSISSASTFDKTPFFTSDESELGSVESGNSRCRFVNVI
jgi:hypothetical protein